MDTLNVLLIEDSAVAQAAGIALLEELGCQVVVAGAGYEAIKKTKEAPHFDLILLDLGLPDIDALTVVENIRENYEVAKKPLPPIVALTAYDDPGFQSQCLNAGMSAFLAKPLTREAALNVLHLAHRPKGV